MTRELTRDHIAMASANHGPDKADEIDTIGAKEARARGTLLAPITAEMQTFAEIFLS
jgi:hypothetical protein